MNKRKTAALGFAWLAMLAIGASCEDGGQPASPNTDGGRVTVTLAVSDDSARRSALYALEQGIVTSERVDVAISYLSAGDLAESTAAGRHDVVEASPLAMTEATANGLGLRLLSSGQVDLDGTLLFAPADSRLDGPSDLRSHVIGVASLPAVSTLEARFVLSEQYHLLAAPQGEDVILREAPADSLEALLVAGELDAAVLPPVTAHELLAGDDYRVISRLAEEYRSLAGAPAVQTVLLTHEDVVEQKRDALAELTRMLAASISYQVANRDEVIELVAGQDDDALAYLRWWWQAHDFAFGPLSEDRLAEIAGVWEAATALGDLDSHPDPAAVSVGFSAGGSDN